jgi:molecular chaperone DnaK (HSP70)
VKDATMAKTVGIDLGTTNSVNAGKVLAAALFDTSVLEQTAGGVMGA